ncbi:hypothetical protein ABH995_000991 [Bradyrhizobium yuanmingense]
MKRVMSSEKLPNGIFYEVLYEEAKSYRTGTFKQKPVGRPGKLPMGNSAANTNSVLLKSMTTGGNPCSSVERNMVLGVHSMWRPPHVRRMSSVLIEVLTIAKCVGVIPPARAVGRQYCATLRERFLTAERQSFQAINNRCRFGSMLRENDSTLPELSAARASQPGWQPRRLLRHAVRRLDLPFLRRRGL